MDIITRRSRTGIISLLLFTTAILITPIRLPATVVANDGGITLWVSYDNLDVTNASVDDTITEADSLPGGFSCEPTNTGRSAVGAPNSPPSCPGGTGSCTGREKIQGDLEKLADYIYASTEGSHYLRRVYVSDQGRAWNSADIKWNVGLGGSSSPVGAWTNPDVQMTMQSAYRTCIHDVAHHELGHYAYSLPDRYANSSGYYQGTIGGSAPFQVNVTARDINTVMSNNFPHLFVDTTNASITVDYDQPGPGTTTGEVLTPDLLSDADPDNDGPNRAHHGFTMPFAQDEWSLLPDEHADLTSVHIEGTFANPGARPAVDIVFIGDDEPHPGTVLLLDRSGSMGVTTNGITAAQFVQEAGIFLYHSSEPGDLVGTHLYNANVEELFPYAMYDASNDLPFVSFRNATGLTNIAEALKVAIDALIAEHGEGGVSGAEIYLMSDGKQTTGSSLWDEVTRANERGIRIHTFSFGDADTTTMDSIATGTSGSSTLLSEKDDAAELKMIMTRRLSTDRGNTPVFSFKGEMTNRITLGDRQLFIGQFDVPPKTRHLQFYTFLHAGDASQALRIGLESPDGASFTSNPPGNLESKGRFNAVKVDQPGAGTWKFIIESARGGLPTEPIEITAYADNRELKGRVWFEGFNDKDILTVRARLLFRYPLTNMDVNAKLYLGGTLIATVPLSDDGESNGDYQAKDGIYSARLDLSPVAVQKMLGDRKLTTQKLRVETEFAVTESSIPAPLAHYETGTTPEMLQQDYADNQASFKVWATSVINLAERDRDEQEKPRIDLVDPGKPITVAPGKSDDFIIRLVNARPLIKQLRVTLGRGVEVTIDEDKSDSSDAPLGQSYTVQVSVANDAELGSRDLVLQYGGMQVVKPNAVQVGSKDDIPPVMWLVLILAILLAIVLILHYLERRKKQA